MRKLSPSFYNRDTITVAKNLIGKYIVHVVGDEQLVGRIIETEAYKGVMDKACHTYRGKRTKRTEVMWGPPGHAYLYFIYGMYYCMNIVTEEKGNPCAVLLRGVEPVCGIEKMARNRYHKPYKELTKAQIKNLSNGPGKLCIALGLTKKQYGLNLWGDHFYVAEDDKEQPITLKVGKRINIHYAEEAADYPWRFFTE